MALSIKPSVLDLSAPWQLIYWSPKPSIKPLSCADWPASLQKRPKINLKPGSCIWLSVCLAWEEKGSLTLWCKLEPHSSSPNTLLSPPPPHPVPSFFSFFLTAFCSSSPPFAFPKFWHRLGEIKSVWLAPVKPVEDKYWGFFKCQKRREGKNECQRTERRLCPDSHECPCWQREASWQPQPEVKAPISYS